MQPQERQPSREEFIKSLFKLEVEDNISIGDEGRSKLIVGINRGVDAIKVSYGSAGSNAIIESDLYPFSETSNDGKKILYAIKLKDPVEQMGLNILREVADKSDRESGDGRKTSVVLTGAIINEGLKVEGSPMDIKHELDECLPIIIKSIEDQTKSITVEEVGNIAAVAGESSLLGDLFQTIYQEIGKEGIVELDNSGTSDTYYETVNGVRLLNCGFMWPYMANEDKGRKAVYKYPKVLITKQKINNFKEIDNILKGVSEKLQRDELVIFCEDIDQNISTAMAYLHQGILPDGKSVQPFKTLIIKAPILWKDWLYEDFAKVTGAQIVDPSQGKTLKNFQLTWLGSCDRIITSKEETIVVGIQDISDHIKVLEEEGTEEARLRLSRLNTKTAILKLGANSETELSYLRGKALDARNASYLALNGGVVEGGGYALYSARNSLPDTTGGNILKKALQYPISQIAENMGLVMDGAGELVPFSEDILDPATVVKNAITNALSVAGTVLTTKAVITKPKA